MAKWYERSIVRGNRIAVEECLEGLPPATDKNETASAFWARVEKAGLLIEALELYDEFAADEFFNTPRETKKDFAERIEREGRQAEVERVRNDLLASGHSLREIQEKLVKRFQPLDGSIARPWTTPDPWKAGRLFRKKADQERLQELADPEYDDEDEKEAAEARWRVKCAEWRREERVALANARKRAWELKAAATVEFVNVSDASAKMT